MRVPRALVAIAALSALVFIACGDGGDEPDATSTAPPPTATTPLAPLVDVPGRPNAFADYPGVVGIYLTVAGPGALGAPCLDELVVEWEMDEPNVPLTPEERCLVGNTDSDSDGEVVALFTAESDDGFGLLSNVVVFDSTPDGYVAVFESWTPDQFPEVFPPSIVAAEDVTGDGNGDLVYTSTACGASTCTLAVHVATGDGDVYSELTPDDGIFMATADLILEDQDGDGAQELVLKGGHAGSVGAGPQRTRTEVYGWNGVAYELQETTFDPTDVLYFHILDADALFDAGNFAVAAQAYGEALADESLVETGFYENELAELGAYGVLRIALSQLVVDELQAGALAALAQGIVDYAGTVNVGLIEAFQQGYNATGNYPGVCLAIREHIDANLDDFQAVWEYGYANPAFDAERICPF